MKTPEPTLAPSSAPRRPSLFEQPDSPVRAPHREIAVLAPFEPPRGNALSQNWATAGVVAVGTAFTLLFGATIWAVFRGDAPADPPMRTMTAKTPPPPATTAPAAKTATPPAAAAPMLATVEADKQASTPDTATLISEAPAKASVLDSAGNADPLLAALQKPNPAPQESAPPAPQPETKTRSPQASPAPRVAAATAAPKPAATSAKADKPVAKKPKQKPEADTMLLAALVSHVQASDAAALKSAGSRDVVVADRMSSTTELVARCDRLGGQEAKLCRNRICKGLWGLEPACPAR